MLTNKQKEIIRKIKVFKSAEWEWNGKMIDGFGKEFSLPTSGEITEMAFGYLKNAGFSKVQRVSPNKANCIIRISGVNHLPYSGEYTINYFEVNYYTRKKNAWIMEDILGNEYEINYSSHTNSFSLLDDNDPPIIIDPDYFFDIYVKVS